MMGHPPYYHKEYKKGIDYTITAEEHREKEKLFWEEALKTLGSIEENTACFINHC